MKLTILGAGTLFAGINQTASAYLLEASGLKILVDCGPGTLVRLSQIGVSVFDIDAVFITHFHPDHTSDLFPLFMNYRITDTLAKKKPTRFPQIFGPEGIYQYMLRYSRLSQLRSVEGWEKIKFTDSKSKQKLGDVKIEAFKVLHKAFNYKAKAYAYRFGYGGKVITFSGDAAKCPGIEKACKNADIFICDCSFPRGIKGPVHMNTEEIGQISQKNRVKKLLLTHFYPFYSPQILFKEVKENFSGETVIGRDLMKVPLEG